MLPCALSADVPLLIDFDASSENEAIAAVAGQLAGDPRILQPDRFLEAVYERQKINPPLLGSGIALPHARCTAVSEIVMAVGRLASPVKFGDTPVRLIFLVGVPPQRISEYLAMTASLARRLRAPGVVEKLLSAKDEETFRAELAGS
ncbi:PTS sugar transporter subunit IIA [Luteolibacter luteus]|uniref:PTS sugar transporter subunit IIA n=1 Tax=Luteolibacter luteus TaxID=2728835 RepID=A0A858RH86_9BACT|nr:PTS sugar transporter subunit IIA [Luteolibacter luteus]QJE96172.1 PTS sugar transporter subunit IIA [Luteolibacter luteus]